MKQIFLSPPHMGGHEIKYIREAFDSNWIAPVGENIQIFQQQLADFLGNGAEVTVLSSGTAAIHLALIMLGVESNDEVICQSFTFSASVNPILYQKAVPVLVDSEKDTWNMCPEQLEHAIKDRIRKGKKPKAIILVDLYGMPCKMDELLGIARKYEIPVIEDAAEALGSVYKGKSCGTFGEMGILSFNGNKIITSSSGGAIVSKNADYIQQAKFYAGQSKDPAPFYKHSKIGYNYQLSNILAGIGRGQMEVLSQRIEERRKINAYYREALKETEGICFHVEPNKDFFSNFWLTAILVDPEKLSLSNLEICEIMNKKQIECRPVWNPMHLQPIFRDAPYYGTGISDQLFARGICLPSGSGLEKKELKYIVSVLKETIEEERKR
ncbi:MAG: aminotransferase class I/II-fold pyridoxal phosphate-dependent enzyme [Candidatus Azobacteroides sp.]|nr:aminotransferase class I/II-fold pyridoxal phosphate-dependent enzyme [Candidatus Azobacteroides sp.]